MSGIGAALLASLLSLPLLASAAIAAEGSGQDSPTVRAAMGRTTFRIYCQSCHGETARGDGPLAGELKVAPADLTRLQRDNRGVFPADEVYAAIDGRAEVEAHGRREMPVWGLSFQDRGRDSDQEEAVADKIRDLVAYLESIQTEEGVD